MKNPRTAMPSESSVACCTERPFFRLTMCIYGRLHKLIRQSKAKQSIKRRGMLSIVNANTVPPLDICAHQ